MALNNAGIVYHFTGDNHSAEAAFRAAAGVLLRGPKGRPSYYVRKQKRQQAIMQGFSGRNVGLLFEAQFNLAQLYQVTGHPATARKVWMAYLTKLDWSSAWARYAANRIKVDLSRVKPGPVPQVAGVAVGAPIPAIVRAWGRPARERNYMNYTVWQYRGGTVSVYLLQGFAKRILVRGAKAPRVSNGIAVSMPRSTVEKRFGPPPMKYGRRVVYPRRHMVVIYSGDRVAQVVLYR